MARQSTIRSGHVSLTGRLFFRGLERRAIVEAVGEAAARSMSRAGAFIARRARSSMRRRKRASKPGEPPSAHRGDLKKLLFFSFDPKTLSVVVGPVPLNGRAAIVPRVMELGGAASGRVNPRRITRQINGSGEIRIGGASCKATKRTKNTLSGTVDVTYAKLHTAAQVERANEINEELYGPLMLPAVTIAPRPYMGPAMEAELPKLPPLWANAVR